MAGEKNFNIKNGLSVGGVEVITSAGALTGTAIVESIDDRVNALLVAGTGITLTYDDSAGSLTVSGQQGDITGIVAGAGLTGDATSGDATLAVGAGTGMTVNANDIAIDFKDEDDMSSNSASHAATQQSVKAYVDAQILTKDNTDEIAEGSSNLYFTDARAEAVSINNVVEDTSPQLGANLDGQAFDITTTGKVLYSNVYSSEGDLPSASTYHGMFAHVHGTGAGYFAHAGAWKKLLDESSSTTANLTENTNLYFTNERVDDRVSSLLVAGTNISTTYDDAAGTLTIASSGKTEEEIEDIVNGLVVGGTNITSTYDDAAGTLTLSNDYGDAQVQTFLGGGSLSGHIIPNADVTYDLGSTSKQWRDIYVGPGSLYVNGQQVVSDNSGTITVSADTNQNVSVQTSGSGDVELNPTGSGAIQLKGGVQITAGKNVSSSDGNAIAFSNSIDVDAIESRSTDTNLTLSANGTGVVAVSDSLTISGNLTVSGTTTTVNSETINLADNIIALNSDFTSGSPTQDSGISITRGGSAAKTLVWDETNDKWTVGSETFVASTFEGNLTGNVTGNTSGNAGSATVLQTARTISLAGDVSGSVSFNGSADVSITATIADDSHNHTIANVDGLQTALDTKYQSGSNVSLGTVASGAITITNATNSGGTARNIYQSTSTPSGSDGAVGDLWIYYS
jgi:hypothetical protein